MTDVTAPEWLVAAADVRVSFMLSQMGGIPDGYPFILTPLTEPPAGWTDAQRERWERTCDHCGLYCPEGTDFLTGLISRDIDGTRIEITFGACRACADPT